MGRTFQVASGETNTWGISPAETAFSALCMNYGDDGFSSAEENQTQITYRGGEGVMGGLSVLVSGNTLTTASMTIRTRKNGANAQQVVVVPPGTTGLFSDVVNADSLSDGDTYNCQIVADAGGSGSASIRYVGIWQRAVLNHRIQYGAAEDALVGFVASTTYFCHLAGNIALETVENSVKAQIDVAGTWAYLHCGVAVNGRSTSTIIKTRKNNADGNQSLLITSGSTGNFEDTSNTDSVAVGDDINYTIILSTGTGTFGIRNLTSVYENNTVNKSNIYSSTSLGRSKIPGDVNNSGIAGMLQVNNLAEGITQQNTNFDFIASNLKCYISANTFTSASTLALRKNGANANQSVSITALTTGLFEDVSNTDTFLSDDDANYQWTGGGVGAATMHWAGMLVEQKPIERVGFIFL